MKTRRTHRFAARADRERMPRPIGAATGVPWEPREAKRSYAKNVIQTRLIEWIMESPLQGIGAAIMGAYAKAFVHDDGTPGREVANEAGSWKFAAVGDYGSGSVHSSRVAANILGHKPELLITVGDNVYPSGRWQDYAKNFDPDRFWGKVSRAVPFMPSIGNHDEIYHDDVRPYFGHFPHLNGLLYYSYTYRNVDFVTLDGDQDLRPGSAQYKWLENELASSKSTYRVVYMHYPMFSDEVGDFVEMRKSLQPLLKKYRVQLVVAGHVHNYQRSIPIDGTTHIITGNGGQQVFASRKKRQPYVAYRKAVYGHVEFSVGPTRMVMRSYDEDGNVIDVTTIPAGAPLDAARGAKQLTARTSRVSVPKPGVRLS